MIALNELREAIATWVEKNDYRGKFKLNESTGVITLWRIYESNYTTPVAKPTDPQNNAAIELAWTEKQNKLANAASSDTRFDGLVQANHATIKNAASSVANAQIEYDAMGAQQGGKLLFILCNLLIKHYMLERELAKANTINDVLLE